MEALTLKREYWPFGYLATYHRHADGATVWLLPADETGPARFTDDVLDLEAWVKKNYDPPGLTALVEIERIFGKRWDSFGKRG